LGEYKTSQPLGHRLKDRNVTIINRSEIVGRPLAALLANEGATVYSVDMNNVQTFLMRKGHHRCKVFDTDITCAQAVRKSDIVITGVPAPDYSVPTKLLKPGVVAINFSTFSNFEPDVTTKASHFVPSVGKVTVAMLEKNLLRLYDYQQGQN
jgi:methylenetetrahydrofolate dehydrogenase (NAD+)